MDRNVLTIYPCHEMALMNIECIQQVEKNAILTRVFLKIRTFLLV